MSAAQSGDRRGWVFAVIVLVLAAVGVYVTMMPSAGEQAPQTGPPSRTSEAVAPAPGGTPLATASGAPFDIYAYLPMSEQELAAAADLAERFTAAYGTYRFDEDPAAYAGRVKAFTTVELGEVLTRTLTSAGTVERNRAEETVSVGTAKMKEIRQVDRTSVVFVVTGTQEVAAKSGATRRADDYAVTLTQVGSGWRVFDLQPADAGQDGDAQG